MSIGRRDKIIGVVVSDEDVQSEWFVVAEDMEAHVGRKLIKMIVEEWVKSVCTCIVKQ